MSDQEFILAPPTVTTSFSLEPMRNHYNSLGLLNQDHLGDGLSEWVSNTVSAMSADRRRKNLLVMNILLTWNIKRGESDFDDHVSRLAQADPDTLKRAVGQQILGKCHAHGIDAELDDLLGSQQAFVDTIVKVFKPHYDEKGKDLDLTLYEEAYPLIDDPVQMQATIVEHLRYMWNTHLKDDWERNLPMLTESVNAFRQLDYRGQTAIETVRFVTGRDVSGYFSGLDTSDNITFIPSAHLGPYVAFNDDKGTKYLIFGARVPEGVSKSSELSRSELLVRLNALSDDTRLKILEMMTRHEEVCAQDIINWLDLSQSSASRHLRQLTATGYLTERRRDVAKCYTLNRERVEDTLFALKHFLKI